MKNTLPAGNVLSQFNLGVHKDRTYIRHNLSQAEQLDLLRKQASPSRPSAFKKHDEFLLAASTTNRRAFKENMHANRLEIERALADLEKPGAPLPKRGALRRLAKGVKEKAASAFMVGVLSFASEKEANTVKAYRTPLKKAERKKESRTFFSSAPKPLAPTELLGQDNIDMRVGEHRIRNAKHLLKRAREDHEVASLAKTELRENLREVLPDLVELMIEGEQLLDRWPGANGGAVPDAYKANTKAIVKTLAPFASPDDVILNLPILAELIAKAKPLILEPPTKQEALAIAQKHLAKIEDQRKAAEKQLHKLETKPGWIDRWKLDRAKHQLAKFNDQYAEAVYARDAARDAAQEAITTGPEYDPEEDGLKQMNALLDSIARLFLHPGRSADLRSAKRNVSLAQQLVDKANRQMEGAKGRAKLVSDCGSIILELKGFDKSGDPAPLGALQKKFDDLFRRLDARNDLPESALDRASVFKRAYQAVVDALTLPGEEADPARAVAVLDELMHPSMTLAKLTDDTELSDPDLTDDRRQVIEDTRRVAQALAPLRRGMEVIARVITGNNGPIKIEKRGLAPEQQAVKTFLLAGEALDEKQGALVGSTKELLEAAQVAARKLQLDPKATLTDSERVAYVAVHNRLTDASAHSEMQYASDRLTILNDKWIPRAVKRSESTFGAVGQGGHTGFSKALDLMPTTGKTPLNKNTLKLASKTSTAYGRIDDATDIEIDTYVTKSAEALRQATMQLARAHPQAAMRLLIPLAAADVAKEKMAEPGNQGLRPEHCRLGELVPPATVSEDLGKIRARVQLLGQQAGLDTNGEEFTQFVGGIRDPLHSVVASPLQAENLFLWKRMLSDTVNALELERDNPVRQMAGKAVSEVRHLEDLFDTSGPGDLKTAEDIYAYLVRKIEQVPERGRFRLASGGLLGVNLKPFTYSIKAAESIARTAQLIATGGLAAFSVAPKLKLETQFGRSAALEIAMSSMGFEVFIGTETRVSKSLGGGIGASGGNTLVKGGVSVEKTGGDENIVQEGVKFMIPRSATGEYSDEEMRKMGMKLLDQLFGMEAGEDGVIRHLPTQEFNGGADVNGVPNNLARIMANCPYVSIAVVDDSSERSSRQDSGLTLSGRLGGGSKKTTGSAVVSFGVKSNYLNSRELNITELTGYCNIERHNVANGGQLTVGSGIGPSANHSVSDDGHLSHSAGASTSGANRQAQVTVAGKDAKMRVTSMDGRTDASKTRRDIEHTNADSLAESINANREVWIQTGVDLLFKTRVFKHLADAPLTEQRKFIEQRLDATLEEMRQSELSPEGGKVLRNVFSESRRITDVAATEYDDLRDEQAQIEAHIAKLQAHSQALKARGRASGSAMKAAKSELKEAQNQRTRIIDTQTALLQHPASWQPWKITAVERTAEGRQKGFDLFLKASAADAARGQLLLISYPY